MTGQPSPSELASIAELGSSTDFQRLNLVKRYQAADWYKHIKLKVAAPQLNVSRAIRLACRLARHSRRDACVIRQQADSLQCFRETVQSWLGGGEQQGGSSDAFESQTCVAYVLAATTADSPTATAGLPALGEGHSPSSSAAASRSTGTRVLMAGPGTEPTGAAAPGVDELVDSGVAPFLQTHCVDANTTAFCWSEWQADDPSHAEAVSQTKAAVHDAVLRHHGEAAAKLADAKVTAKLRWFWGRRARKSVKRRGAPAEEGAASASATAAEESPGAERFPAQEGSPVACSGTSEAEEEAAAVDNRTAAKRKAPGSGAQGGGRPTKARSCRKD